MKTSELVNNWKNFLLETNQIHINEKEIILLLKEYEKTNSNLIKEGVITDFLSRIKQQSFSLFNKIKKVKNFIGNEKIFKNFVTFIKNRNIKNIAVITLASGITLIACSEDPKNLSNPYAIRAELNGVIGSLDVKLLEELEDGRKAFIIEDQGVKLVEIEQPDNNDASEQSGEPKSDIESGITFETKTIQDAFDESIYGAFFVDIELQQSLLDQANNIINNLDFNGQKVVERSISTGNKQYKVFIIDASNVDDKAHKQIANDIVKDMINSIMMNFDSESRKLLKLFKGAQEEYNITDSQVNNFLKNTRRNYKELYEECLKSYSGRSEAFVCAPRSPTENHLLEKLDSNYLTSLFSSFVFYKGNTRETAGSIRHEISHIIKDHRYVAYILNDLIHNKINFSGNDEVELSRNKLESLIKSTKSFEIANISIDNVILELLNSGQIKKSNNNFIVYSSDQDYMSNYNEIRQHRIDTSFRLLNLKKSTQMSDSQFNQLLDKVSDIIRDYTRIINKSGGKIRFIRRPADTNIVEMFSSAIELCARSAKSKDVEEFKEKVNDLNQLLTEIQLSEDDNNALNLIITVIFQLSSGHGSNITSTSNEFSLVRSLFDLIKSNSTENAVKAIKNLKNVSTPSKKDIENIIDNLMTDDPSLINKSKSLLTYIKENQPSSFKLFLKKYKELTGEDFSVQSLQSESFIIEKVYKKLVLESLKIKLINV